MANITVTLDIVGGKHFSICPTTVEVGDAKRNPDVNDGVTWRSRYRFVVHFLGRSPFDLLELRGEPVDDIGIDETTAVPGYMIPPQVRGDAEQDTYPYAVGIFDGNQVHVHVSGEVRKHP